MTDTPNILAPFEDEDGELLSPAAEVTTKHPPADRCFYCMGEATFQKAWAGEPHPTIHMDLPAEACPDFRPDDWEDQP